MKKLNAFLVSVLATAALNAAVIEQVIVRQQWPWSTDVKIEYKISAVTNPVDIAVKAYNGDVELSLPTSAITGDRYGITEDGVGTLVIDPVAAFGTEKVALANFKVKLTISDSASNIGEALYKIFNLETGSCTDVTRADLLNGKYGGIETDYAKIGPDFTTPLQDVLIWTGVTNNPTYMTTNLVMRKISAKDVVWLCGDAEGASSGHGSPKPSAYVQLKHDYYVGVFELTQYQFAKVYGSAKGGFSDKPDSPIRPVETVARHEVNYHPSFNKGVVNTDEFVNWPTNSYLRDTTAGTFMAKLRQLTNVEFDLPSAVEWQFACRAGSDTPLYSGKAQVQANAYELGWCLQNEGTETHAVGQKAANAYGLYDMLGNVEEYVHTFGPYYEGSQSGSGTVDDPYVDPVGSRDADQTTTGAKNRLCMGGSWSDATGWWQDLRQACGLAYYKWNAANNYTGFRVVCPVGAQWSAH